MMKMSLISAVFFLTLAGPAAAQETAPRIYESSVPPKPASELDRIVLAKLSSLDIQPTTRWKPC